MASLLPHLIWISSLAYSLLADGDLKLISTNGTSSSSSSSTALSKLNYGSFMYGCLVGVGLTSLISSEIRRCRVLDRIRVAFFSWLYDDADTSPEERPAQRFRRPFAILDVKGEPIQKLEEGTGTSVGAAQDGASEVVAHRADLVSPKWALTSNLKVNVLTLSSGTEIVQQVAPGVEFYNVIKGDGLLKLGEEETYNISAGQGFLVDPGRVRGFVSRGSGSLVLLRATDAVNGGENDVSRHQPSSLSSAVSMISSGVKGIKKVFRSYN